ncbi:MAG: VOC family protein [Acidimicrobiia bacterium]|nr:VOC family protein [Acidimicrobiia bacterium]MBT8217889.1 VOC family protein [Acidimicrobiia bacterium]NNF09229.1 VOC family protein [Acidimicrobiia bacterium]NNL71134.1 VOC family protein [Acidimicrobiia bacterium]
MPERVSYAHGVPSWVDLGTTDVEGAKAFYGAVFGWEAEDVPTPQGIPYTMLRKDGKLVAGMGPMDPERMAAGVPPVWNTYVNVDSVDDTVAKATAAGGSVAMPAMDVMDTGRMAFITDPTGAAIGLWEPGSHMGAELVNEHGTLFWNELITDDTAAATEFYAAVFGWKAETAEMPNGPYTSFWADGNVEGNAAAGMLGKTEEMQFPNSWGVYFAIDDVEETLNTVKDNGGQVLMQPMDVPQVGRFAVVQDPQGAVITVMKPEGEQN